MCVSFILSSFRSLSLSLFLSFSLSLSLSFLPQFYAVTKNIIQKRINVGSHCWSFTTFSPLSLSLSVLKISSHLSSVQSPSLVPSFLFQSKSTVLFLSLDKNERWYDFSKGRRTNEGKKGILMEKKTKLWSFSSYRSPNFLQK